MQGPLSVGRFLHGSDCSVSCLSEVHSHAHATREITLQQEVQPGYKHSENAHLHVLTQYFTGFMSFFVR